MDSSCVICGGVFYKISKKDGHQHHMTYTGSHGLNCHMECLDILHRYLDINFPDEKALIDRLQRSEERLKEKRLMIVANLDKKIRAIIKGAK